MGKNEIKTKDIDQFAESIADMLQKEYSEAGQKEVSVSARAVKKNNGVILHGIVVKDDSASVVPTVYIDGIYREYLQGMDIEECRDKVMEIYSSSINKKINIPDGFMQRFEDIQENIFPKLINAERNSQLLESVPHALIGDLAVIFQVHISEFDGEGIGTVVVNNDLMGIWNVEPEQIFRIAMENLNKKGGIRINSLYSIVSEIMLKTGSCYDNDICERQCDENTPQMYVMTNETKINGAIGILSRDKLAEFADRMDSDLFILPSSINELIILPRKGMENDIERLLEMVKEVNATEVSEEAFLSNNVYTFIRKDRSLCMALTGEEMELRVA